MSLAGAGATSPGGPGPVLVSASDHQHLSPHIEGSVHQEADHWPHGLMVIVKVRTLVILKIRRDRRRGASASMHKLCVFLHTFYFPDVCWHDSHYLQSAPTSAQLINGVNTEIEIPQIFTQHCIISVILPNIGVPWLALSLGCSIKNILDPGTWENLFSQISSLSTFFVFTWSNYQILFWVPTNIALWTPVIFVELPLFRVAFFSVFYFVKYGIPAFRD